MPSNFYMYFLVALIPLVVGAIYYGTLFQKAYMEINGFTESPIQHKNKAVIFGLSYLLSLLLCQVLVALGIHQVGVVALGMHGAGEFTPEALADVNAFLAKYGNTYRSFGHGVAHGMMASIFFALPILSINAMFEGRGWKYTLLHWGYWTICLTLMSGILCATLKYGPLG